MTRAMTYVPAVMTLVTACIGESLAKENVELIGVGTPVGLAMQASP